MAEKVEERGGPRRKKTVTGGGKTYIYRGAISPQSETLEPQADTALIDDTGYIICTDLLYLFCTEVSRNVIE